MPPLYIYIYIASYIILIYSYMKFISIPGDTSISPLLRTTSYYMSFIILFMKVNCSPKKPKTKKNLNLERRNWHFTYTSSVLQDYQFILQASFPPFLSFYDSFTVPGLLYTDIKKISNVFLPFIFLKIL